MRPEAPGKRRPDTGFEDDRKGSKRTACWEEGHLVRPRARHPVSRLVVLVGREGTWGVCACSGFGRAVGSRHRGVLHPGRQCRAKCRASHKDEVDKGPADIGLQKK